MSTAYHYLIASLFPLQLGARPPLSSLDFLEYCREQLRPEDFEVIRDVILQDDVQLTTDHDLAVAWKRFNHDIRNEVAWLRALKANKNPQEYVRGEKREEDPHVVDLIARATEAEHPLAAERIIDQARWDFLDAAIQFHYFDLEVIMAYALKLKILERYQTIDSPRGKELFSEYTKLNLSLN